MPSSVSTNSLSVSFLQPLARREISDWLEEPMLWRAVLKCASTTSGELFVMMPGARLMPWLPADNWDSMLQVDGQLDSSADHNYCFYEFSVAHELLCIL